MRILRAVFEPTTDLLAIGVADLFHRRETRAKPIGDDAPRSAIFLHDAPENADATIAVATRLFRISAANIGPSRFHQNRTVSWLISIPRSAKRSSTLRSDSGDFTYIITTRLNHCWRTVEISERVKDGPGNCSDNVLSGLPAGPGRLPCLSVDRDEYMTINRLAHQRHRFGR
jgi:hypothetical protein